MSNLMLHAIDCDADPFIPDGWIVLPEDHFPNRVKGIFIWDPTKVSLYLSKHQKGHDYLSGNDLCEELKNKPVLNACVLDYLLANPHLIPEEWERKLILFWGTIYSNPNDGRCVRFLYGFRGAWIWGFDWLGENFNSRRPAVVLAS
jgi:hypothetical protein